MTAPTDEIREGQTGGDPGPGSSPASIDGLQLLEALHRPNERQGPGSDAATRQAMALAELTESSKLRIADLGCGTGAAALTLAQTTDSQVTAVDFLPGFIAEAERRAADAGVGDRMSTLVGDIAAPPFEAEELDVIWSEGAIYNLGFREGLDTWRPLLRPGGILAVSELTWLSAERPDALTEHWEAQYAQVATAGVKIAELEAAGYDLLGYFALPQACWVDHYYGPLEARLPAFLDAFDHSDEAKAIAAAEKQEFALYQRFHAFYSYGFYIARRSV